MKPGDKVKVVAAIDTDIHDVSGFVGKTGTVRQVGGFGDLTFDEMLLVKLDVGGTQTFWPEELATP